MRVFLGILTGKALFCSFPAAAWLTPPDHDAALLSQQQSLPNLGSASVNESGTEKKLATFARQMAEVNQDENTEKTWRSYLLEEAKDGVLNRLQQKSEAMLSPLGYTAITLDVDESGRFNGSSGQLLLPLADVKTRGLTYGQLGLQGVDDGVVGNMGLGQRWNAGRWLLGYNVFYDQYLNQNALRRGSIGAEARSDYLTLSSNYYYPLSTLHAANDDDDEQVRMASGYDITTQGYLPFYRQLGASVKYEQYFGQRVSLFDSGNYRTNPAAVELGVSYTPVPLMTLSAKHKLADDGESAEQYQLTLNYRLGVPLHRQLSADYVAEAHSLRGSRYDLVQRNAVPVLAFKQRKTQSVFLATPPWSLQPGSSLALKVQVSARYPLTAVSWQGDTRALSLTQPSDSRQPDGWSIILPSWDDAPDARNEYRLSVTVEDDKQQRVTSNWIVLKLNAPLQAAAHPEEALVLPAGA